MSAGTAAHFERHAKQSFEDKRVPKLELGHEEQGWQASRYLSPPPCHRNRV
jgi:hypothetical protein